MNTDMSDCQTAIDFCLDILCGGGVASPWISKEDHLAARHRRAEHWYHPRVVSFFQAYDARREREQEQANWVLDEPRHPATAREYFRAWEKGGKLHYPSVSICPYWDRGWCFQFLRDEILPQWQSSREHLTSVLQWLGVEIATDNVSTEDLYSFLESTLWESPRLTELAWMYWPLSTFVRDHPSQQNPRVGLSDRALLALEKALLKAFAANEEQAMQWAVQSGKMEVFTVLERLESEKALTGVA